MGVVHGAIAALTALLVAPASARADGRELSQLLVKPAEKAAKAHDWPHAIALYQALVIARGAGSDEAEQLATLWELAGQHEDAAAAWSAFAAATSDAGKKQHALAEVARLAAAVEPPASKLAIAELPTESRQLLALGRSAFAARRYDDALIAFQVGYALAPDQPGFVRELGATYDKLGRADDKRDLYRRFLVQRPFGPNADAVRAELAKDPDALGTLVISSSLPCTELWLNRQRITGKLPAKALRVAPGSYKGLCYSPKFEMALFEYATVEPGKPATMTFAWAIVVNQLEHPLGRIAVENPKAPGTMVDLGITSPEVGVAVPADHRKLKMRLEDDTGSRSEERMVQIEPGTRVVVKW